MDDGQKDLSHEEVWDDSALIDSWNQALDEYKKYHSVYAKGGSIRDLDIESLGPSMNEAPDQRNGGIQNSGNLKETKSLGESNSITDVNLNEQVSSCHKDGPQPNHGSRTTPSPFPAQALLGTVRDENLKKLLMSWYYAGYYTGLYEGQQKTQ